MMVSRRFKPCNMNGCVLYLPFYAYGGNAQKIWDMSGQGNHGVISGAVPGSYPILAGSDLVTNGGMEIGNPPMGWSATDTPEIFESSGVQKYSGNSSVHINDSIPSYGGTQQKFNPSAQKTYKFSYRYYIVSGVLGVRATDVEVGYVYNVSHSTTGSWQYAEGFFSIGVPNPNDYIWFFNNSASVGAEFYIDDVSVQEITGYESLGWKFDGSTAYLDLGTSSQWTFGTGDFSAGFWMRSRAWGGYMVPLSNSVYTTSWDGFHFEEENGPGTLGTIRFQVLNTIRNSTTVLSPGRWYHVVGVRKSGVSDIFINGAVEGTGLAATGNVNVARNYLIGKNQDTTYPRYFNGTMGEVIIFNRALSAEEIKSYYELTRSRYGV